VGGNERLSKEKVKKNLRNGPGKKRLREETAKKSFRNVPGKES
jgi:hypothetical protein